MLRFRRTRWRTVTVAGMGATVQASYGFNAAGGEANLAYQNLLEARQFSVSVQLPLWQWGAHGEGVHAAEAYFTAGVLARGMSAFNAELLRVCRDRRVECVDAAATLSDDRTAMYDDMHVTELGAQKLAKILGDYVRERPPFR